MSLRSSIKLGVATAAAVAVPFLFAASSAGAYECTNVPIAPGGATPTGPAVACTTVTEVVEGGSLTLTASGTATATSTTLGAKDQIQHYSIAENTGDNTGTGNGWNETISQTTFSSGAHTIGVNSGSGEIYSQTSGAGRAGVESGNTGAAVTNVVYVDAPENTDTNPVETTPLVDPLNVPVPTASATGTAGDAPSVVFQTAKLTTGLGNFIVTPTVSFDVPANTYAGTYTATTEVDLSTGP